jgi:hypothetical protein
VGTCLCGKLIAWIFQLRNQFLGLPGIINPF